MSRRNEQQASEDRRERLTRARVLDAAIDLADREGIAAVSMRRLAQELRIEPMSLYTHVRGKDDLLDGMADAVVARVAPPVPAGGWLATLRELILAARGELLRHPWSAGVIETRAAPGHATIAYMDRVAGILREGGFSTDLAHHALHVLGSRVMGFSQDLFDDKAEVDPNEATAFAAQFADQYPNVAAIALAASHEGGLGGCDDDIEFAFGLDLILDGLEARRRVSAQASADPAPA